MQFILAFLYTLLSLVSLVAGICGLIVFDTPEKLILALLMFTVGIATAIAARTLWEDKWHTLVVGVAAIIVWLVGFLLLVLGVMLGVAGDSILNISVMGLLAFITMFTGDRAFGVAVDMWKGEPL